MAFEFAGLHADRWRRDALAHAVPGPEGFDATQLLQQLCGAPVLDLGCGWGRWAHAFSPDGYLGVDVSHAAIERARSDNPKHRFAVPPVDMSADPVHTVLLYTVMLHFPDDELQQAVASLLEVKPQRLLIVEPLGRQRRSTYAYHRERWDYEAALDDHGFALARLVELPYIRYPEARMSFMQFDAKEIRK